MRENVIFGLLEPEKEKNNGEPKKSTGRDGGQSNSKQDKQTLKEKRKKKNPRFRNSIISVLVVLVLLL
jgi:hypothetical protein